MVGKHHAGELLEGTESHEDPRRQVYLLAIGVALPDACREPTHTMLSGYAIPTLLYTTRDLYSRMLSARAVRPSRWSVCMSSPASDHRGGARVALFVDVGSTNTSLCVKYHPGYGQRCTVMR